MVTQNYALGERLAASRLFRPEAQKFARAARKYCFYYGAKPPSIDEVTADEAETYKNSMISALMKAELNLDDEYSKRVYDSAGGSDMEELLRLHSYMYSEKERKLTELRAKYNLNDQAVREAVFAEKAADYEALEKTLASYEDIFKFYVRMGGGDGETMTNISPVPANIYVYLDTIPLTQYSIRETFGDSAAADEYPETAVDYGYIIVLRQRALSLDGLGESSLSNEILRVSSSDYQKSLKSSWLALALVFAGAVLIICLLIYDSEASKLALRELFEIYDLQPLAMRAAVSFTAVRAMLRAAGLTYSGLMLFAALSVLSVALLYLVFSAAYLLYALRRPQTLPLCPDVRFLCDYTAVFSRKLAYIKTVNAVLSFFILLLGIGSVAAVFACLALWSGPAAYAVIAGGFLLTHVLLQFMLSYGLTQYAAANILSDGAGDSGDSDFLTGGLFLRPLRAIWSLRGRFLQIIEDSVRSERLKIELISGVSHDLRTPLTAIINYIELLKAPELPEERRAEYVSVLSGKAARLSALIDDLFEASKLQSGDTRLELIRINIADLIMQALAEVSPKLAEAAVTVKASFPEEPAYVMADGRRMWRVFENLLVNVSKYALRGTRAYLSVKTGGDGRVRVELKNVAAQELNISERELFERFLRGSRSHEGSGLGLSIVKHILELHGAEVRIIIDGDLFKVIIEMSALQDSDDAEISG
jgi:signal transduction histidine kinase